jgi:hypothetical protein
MQSAELADAGSIGPFLEGGRMTAICAFLPLHAVAERKNPPKPDHADR